MIFVPELVAGGGGGSGDEAGKYLDNSVGDDAQLLSSGSAGGGSFDGQYSGSAGGTMGANGGSPQLETGKGGGGFDEMRTRLKLYDTGVSFEQIVQNLGLTLVNGGQLTVTNQGVAGGGGGGYSGGGAGNDREQTQHGSLGDFGGGGSFIASDGTLQQTAWNHGNGYLTIDLVTTIADPTPIGTLPETGSWAMMITGFGLLGCVLRRRRTRVDLARIQHPGVAKA